MNTIINRSFLLFMLLSLYCANKTFTQDAIVENHALKVVAQAYDGGIKLRWAPTSMYAWQETNKLGYVLERITFKRNNEILPLAERQKIKILTPLPLKPLTEGEDWKPLMERNPNAAIAAQALYGESFSTVGQSNGLAVQLDEQSNRFAFGLFAADQSIEVAEALGLYFDDKTVVKGESYIYRIYPATLPQEMPIDTGFVFLNATDIYTLPKVVDVIGEFTEKYCYISWDKIATERFYTSYEVERSTDGTNFTKLNAMPFVGMDKNQNPTDRMLFRDSIPETDQLYQYRIRGRNIFEQVGPPSDVVQGIAMNPKVTNPNISTISNNSNTSLAVSWEFSEMEEKEILGFQLTRSSSDRGVYEVVSGKSYLEKSSRYFIDENPLPVNYYKIVAVDKYSRAIPSFSALAQLDDETPPAQPTGLRGTVMEDGEMVVSWTPNSEEDCMGYRVYLANRKDRKEYVQLTSKAVRTNFFTYLVPMNTLSEEIFIKVRALDYRQNASEFSEVVTIVRPDSIPPAAPVFISALPTSESVNVVWENSASADVVSMLLERKPKNENNWKTILTMTYPQDINIKNYRDSTLERGLDYEYRLQALDDANLKTYSRVISAAKIDNGIRRSIGKIEAKIDRKQKKILLNWEYETDGDKLSHFVIYRNSGKGSPRKYDVIKVSRSQEAIQEWEYIDQSLHMDTDYHYQVRAMYSDGAQSPLSPKFTVNY